MEVAEGAVGVADAVAVAVSEGLAVAEGEGLGGGSPLTRKRADTFQVSPKNILNSYSPASQPPAGAHSA